MSGAGFIWPGRVALAALLALGAAGCLRLGYTERGKPTQHDARDAGMDSGASDGGRSSPGGDGGGDEGAGGTGGAGAAGDAAPPDSGPPPIDAGADDAAVDDSDGGAADGGMVSPLCPERRGVLFCDGFEDADLKQRWSYNTLDNGTTTRTTAFKRTGLAALRARTGLAGPGGQARWATTALANQRSGHIWFRFYSYVPNTFTLSTFFSIGVMSEIVPPYGGFSLQVYPTRVAINSQSGDWPGRLPFRRDRWVCVELHVYVDASVGIYEAYLDNELAVSSSPTNTLPRTGFTAAEIGVHYAEANQGPVDVYVDDVVLGTTRVPCE